MSKSTNKHAKALRDADADLDRALRDAEDALMAEDERDERLSRLGEPK